MITQKTSKEGVRKMLMTWLDELDDSVGHGEVSVTKVVHWQTLHDIDGVARDARYWGHSIVLHVGDPAWANNTNLVLELSK